jgi:hypothetical protein
MPGPGLSRKCSSGWGGIPPWPEDLVKLPISIQITNRRALSGDTDLNVDLGPWSREAGGWLIGMQGVSLCMAFATTHFAVSVRAGEKDVVWVPSGHLIQDVLGK